MKAMATHFLPTGAPARLRWPASRLRTRYLDSLASVYLYNEYRGYTSLDRVLEAVRAHAPDDAAFIAAIESHRADERKHYVMFRRWFERQGRMPFAIGRDCGHIDHFVQFVFGCTIDELDTTGIIADAGAFERLCRVIALTEARGFRQVESLLKNRIVRSDPVMTRIFQIVHQDEPSHFLPYRSWLEARGRPTGLWREHAADWCIHKWLMLAKLPALFFNRSAPRLTQWPDAAD